MSAKHDELMRRFARAGLYVVTSQSASGGRGTVEIVMAALAAGVTLVQLREKEMSAREFTNLAREARRMTGAANALLIINDRLDVALAVGADGVHLGQDDLPVEEARRLAPDMVIGASTHSVAQARSAQERGASYVNIGPLFPTSTKKGACERLGMKGLAEIAGNVSIPFTVMGGIKREHIPQLVSSGARTIAVVSAVTAAPDPEAAARGLLADLTLALSRDGSHAAQGAPAFPGGERESALEGFDSNSEHRTSNIEH